MMSWLLGLIGLMVLAAGCFVVAAIWWAAEEYWEDVEGGGEE